MPNKTTLTREKEQLEQEQRAVAVPTGGAANKHTVRNIRLIIGREYKNRVTQRSFIISTIVILVLVVIAAFIPTIILYFTSKSNSQTKILVVNNAGSVAGLNNDGLARIIGTTLNGAASQSSGTNTTGQNSSSKPPYAISVQTTTSLNDLENQVKNGSLNILLVLDRPTKQPSFTVVNTGQSQNRPVSEIVTGYILAYAGNILIYIAVVLYGMSVATGVAEEKGSRIMEILVNAATPFQLMAGKIIGIGAAGLSQMACVVLVGIGALLGHSLRELYTYAGTYLPK